MKYPIHEIFYSLQGEGMYAGVPMAFIRLSGCNIDCDFCDTDHSMTEELTVDEILQRIGMYPTRHVVITGGEPLIHDLHELTYALNTNLWITHLETNGTLHSGGGKFGGGNFDWVAVSPKGVVLSSETLMRCNEIKFLVGLPDWEDQMHTILRMFPNELCNTHKMLMPIADGHTVSEQNTKKAIQYCLDWSDFRLCIQMHKYVKVP